MARTLFKFGLIALAFLSSANLYAGQPTAKPVNHVPITLMESVRLDGKIIYLGDIFANTGTKAEIAVAYTPAPGKRAIFDARWLYRIARTHKLRLSLQTVCVHVMFFLNSRRGMNDL